MAGWVQVIWAGTCDVCVNGNYVRPIGRTNVPFSIQTGQNTFAVVTRPPARQIVAKITADIEEGTPAAPTDLTPAPLQTPLALPPPPPPPGP